MTQAKFNQKFKEIYPHWQVMTLTDRRLYYNELMEQYRQNGLITEKQAYSWGHPKFLTSKINVFGLGEGGYVGTSNYAVTIQPLLQSPLL